MIIYYLYSLICIGNYIAPSKVSVIKSWGDLRLTIGNIC